jgi:hypothetical protein
MSTVYFLLPWLVPHYQCDVTDMHPVWCVLHNVVTELDNNLQHLHYPEPIGTLKPAAQMLVHFVNYLGSDKC